MPKRTRKLSVKAKAWMVSSALTRLYDVQKVEADSDPVDTLVETILSQNTTDANSGRSFAALKLAYPDWNLLIHENPSIVADIIRSGGLADIKARRIIEALSFIKHERGEIDLDFLRSLSPSEADSWLARIKGVGPKTRAIVLLFSLDMPAFPVDTHIHRVSRRLGLVGWKVSREKAQEALAKLVPQEDFYSFHINLILHGRQVCRARHPLCDKCALANVCDYYGTRIRGEP